MSRVTSQKRLERKYAEHLAAILRPIVHERFSDNQTAFAKHIGVSQSQVNAILKAGGGERSVGINVLIRLRAYLRVPLDEMLGLPKLTGDQPPAVPPVVFAKPEDLEQAMARALDRKFPDGPRHLPPAPPSALRRKPRPE